MYVKLFTSIYQGTLRGNSRGLLVFTNLLAHCDSHGITDVHPRAIAEEVGLSIEQVREALDELESPDPESRSPEEDGRRIVRIDEHRAWGWRVVNYGKYRAIKNEDERREQNRISQQRYREKHSKQASASVISSEQHKPKEKQKQKEKKIQKQEETEDTRLRAIPSQLLADFQNVRKAKRVGALTSTALDGIEREAEKAAMTLEEAIRYCCEAGWAGFDASWLQKRRSKDLPQETAYQRSMRERMEKFAPSVAAKAPGGPKPSMEVFDVAAKQLG